MDPGYYGFGVLFSDLDDDGWPDILRGERFDAEFVLPATSGTARFVSSALESGLAVSADGREQAGMGVDAGDFNGDGRLDLVTTNFSQDYTSLYRNQGDGLVHRCPAPVRSDRRDAGRTSDGASGSSTWTTTACSICSSPTVTCIPTSSGPGRAPTVSATSSSETSVAVRYRLDHEGGRRTDCSSSSRAAAPRSATYDNDGDIDVLVVSHRRPSDTAAQRLDRRPLDHAAARGCAKAIGRRLGRRS